MRQNDDQLNASDQDRTRRQCRATQNVSRHEKTANGCLQLGFLKLRNLINTANLVRGDLRNHGELLVLSGLRFNLVLASTSPWSIVAK